MPGKEEYGTGFTLFGSMLWVAGFGGFETIIMLKFGWEIAALFPLAYIGKLGFDIVWPPANGNAGMRGNGAGTGYVVQLDPEDPDAGVPRRKA